jgi:hypothetical protein
MWEDVRNFIIAMAIILSSVALLLFTAGCTTKEIVVEYKYIEKNCTSPEEVMEPNVWLPVDWVIIDIEGLRYYSTSNGASLLSNIRSCKYGISNR